MDDHNCDPTKLKRTFEQFASINKFFGASGFLCRMICKDVLAANASILEVCDIGCGGGDLLDLMLKSATNFGLKADITGIDSDQRSIAFCQSLYASSEVRFICDDLFSLAKRGQSFGYCVMSNVLHHFADEKISLVIDALESISDRGFLIADLPRSELAWIGYAIYSFLFLHGSFARIDGLRSIRRGFTKREFKLFANELCRRGYIVKTGFLFPGRLYLFCRKIDK